MTTPSITAAAGRAFLLKTASATSPSNYVSVGSLRTTQMSLNGNPVDVTTKGSAGWQEMLPGAGVTSVSISGSGVIDATNTQLTALRDAILTSPASPILIGAQIVTNLGTYSGKWVVSAFNLTGNHNDAQTYDITLTSTGPITAA